MLITLAKQIYDQFDGRIEMNELINEGWFRQGRYHGDVTGKAKWIKREMYNWAIKEMAARLPRFNDDWSRVVMRF